MSASTYRYGQSRQHGGLRIGVTRHVPRGVPRCEYSARGYFDVWFPTLAPSAALLADLRHGRVAFAVFARRYRAEMRRPEPRQAIQLLAAVGRAQPISLGCFCDDENRCHRAILKQLIDEAEGALPPLEARPARFASPACSMPEIED